MAAAAAAPPPLVLDAHADTLDHVVRALAHSGFLPEAARLMLASPEHLHDSELLYRTREVRGEDGCTLLMRAVERLDVARAGEILGACPTPATRAELLALVDDEGFNALHIACHPDRFDVEAALRLVELLLASGADPLALQCDPEDNDDITSAQILYARSNDDMVWHAIHFAATWSAQLVQRLVQAGASIDEDVEATSTLIQAAAANTAEGVRMIPRLVALGAHETRGNRAMRAFAQHPVEGEQPSDAEVAAALNALVSVGCSLTQPDGDGMSPLDNAADNGNAPVACALLSLGAPATSSSLARGVKHPELVSMLLAAGAPVDALVNFGGPTRSPLMEAARHAALESVEALLAAGASVGLRDSEGDTALVYSVASDLFDFRVVKALLAAGADVNARCKVGSTALTGWRCIRLRSHGRWTRRSCCCSGAPTSARHRQ